MVNFCTKQSGINWFTITYYFQESKVRPQHVRVTHAKSSGGGHVTVAKWDVLQGNHQKKTDNTTNTDKNAP